MGLATIDPHSQKEHTEIHKIPTFGVYQASFALYALSDSVRMAIHFFVNFDIFKWLYLSYYWVYLHQTWGFCLSNRLQVSMVYRLINHAGC